jgi:hypothetical protein
MILIQRLEKFGITHVGHGIIMEDMTPTVTYSHSVWARKYREERLYKIDPIRRYALNTPFEMISWENITMQSYEETYAFEERKRICSVDKGVIISLKRPNCHESFVFGSDYNKFDFSQVYRNHSHKICRIMKSMGDIHKSVNHQPVIQKRMKIAN